MLKITLGYLAQNPGAEDFEYEPSFCAKTMPHYKLDGETRLQNIYPFEILFRLGINCFGHILFQTHFGQSLTISSILE